MSGYLFNFNGHGVFSPNGKVPEMSQAEIDAHNKKLAQSEIEHAKQTGKALLYLFNASSPDVQVGVWSGDFKFNVHHWSKGRHNIARTRLDVWFTGPDGKCWHGVNIGDNDIVRCHRLKKQ